MLGTIIIFAIAIVVGMVGEIIKKLVGAKAGDPGWRGVYFVTFRAHGLIAGALLAVGLWSLGLPLPEFFGTDIGGAILVGLLAGGIAMIGYDVLYEGVRAWIRHQLAAAERRSGPPAAGGTSERP